MARPGQGFARRVSRATLRLFAPLLERATIRRSRQGSKPTEQNPDLAAALNLFKGNPIRPTREFKRARRPPVGKQGQADRVRGRGREASSVEVELCWEKSNLQKSDAQITTDKTNPTGCVRLSQAGYSVDGVRVDPTKYFRDGIFGELAWVKVKENPDRYHATAAFEVYLLGESLGVHDLTISHKPSGEAGQRNYTTALHWGELTKQITEANIVGRTLRLYRPIDHQGPFRIEVV